MLVTCDCFLFQNQAANVVALCSGQSRRLKDTICKASRPEVATEPIFASAEEAFLVSKGGNFGQTVERVSRAENGFVWIYSCSNSWVVSNICSTRHHIVHLMFVSWHQPSHACLCLWPSFWAISAVGVWSFSPPEIHNSISSRSESWHLFFWGNLSPTHWDYIWLLALKGWIHQIVCLKNPLLL